MSIKTSFMPMGGRRVPSSGEETLAAKIKNHPYLIENFPNVSSEEIGWHVYKFNTGLGDTYCYRGNGDNYIKLGTYTVSGYTDGEITGIGANIIWRIIRVNEDGSVRMIAHDYDITGRPAIPNGVPDYTVLRGSSMTGFYDDWFTNRTNLNNYYISGIILPGPFYWDMTGSGTIAITYSASTRIYNTNNPTPKLYDTAWLPREEFRGYIWSANNDIIERQIATPCGIITGDELIIGGIVPNSATSNFSVRNSKGSESICTPNEWLGNFGVSRLVIYNCSGGTTRTYLANGNRAVIRPVINVRGDIEVIGSGTLLDPWVLKE